MRKVNGVIIFSIMMGFVSICYAVGNTVKDEKSAARTGDVHHLLSNQDRVDFTQKVYPFSEEAAYMRHLDVVLERARRYIEEALVVRKKGGDQHVKSPVVVCDIDDTVLYKCRGVMRWTEFCNWQKAIPKMRSFYWWMQKKGLKIVYLTSRGAQSGDFEYGYACENKFNLAQWGTIYASTIFNLHREGLWASGDILWCMNYKERMDIHARARRENEQFSTDFIDRMIQLCADWKASVRAQLATQYDIIATVEDQPENLRGGHVGIPVLVPALVPDCEQVSMSTPVQPTRKEERIIVEGGDQQSGDSCETSPHDDLTPRFAELSVAAGQ